MTNKTCGCGKRLRPSHTYKDNRTGKLVCGSCMSTLYAQGVVEHVSEIKSGVPTCNNTQGSVCDKCGTYCYGDCLA